MTRRLALALLLAVPPTLDAQVDDGARALYAGRYDDAIAAYMRAANRAPESVDAARGLVRALRLTGRYDEAIAAARAFVARPRRGHELWNELGETLVLVGRRAAAESAFVRAAETRASDSLIARLNRALLWQERGETDRARQAFDSFIDVYNSGRRLSAQELGAVAAAVHRLSVGDPDLARDALRAYDQAIAADSTDWQLRVHVGELFLEKYNGTDALAAFEAVLARNPRHPGALLGLARAARFAGEGDPMDLVRQALDVNPGFVDARVFRAQLLAESEDYGEARRELEQALAVNPASLDAWAALAGVRYLAGDDTWRDAERRVLALNPRYAALYVTLAELAARNRLYHEAARFAAQAVELDGQYWRGLAVLGINELRVGRVDSARAHLERAFAGDPFDVWTRNTLELLDDLVEYPEIRSRRFRLYAAASEADLLGLYAAPLAEAAYDSLSRRYGYEPPTPIRIEMFPRHADFSVRTVGLVGLGALGVSFGPVIAMDAPSAREAAGSNWGSTLWHEIAHTFHLGMTDHRVPRWFSEGLAVYEERRARPGWGADVTPEFLIAFREGRLKPVSELNDGFTRPEYPEQVMFSYYQASLVCELIERDHGTRALVAMLRGYGAGRTTDDLFASVLGIDAPAFDGRFERYVEERFGRALAALKPGDGAASLERRARDPNDYAAQVAMGARLLEQGRANEAVAYLQRAKALFPEHARPDSPYRLLAAAHRSAGRLAEAAAELEAMVTINADDHAAYIQLSEVLLELGRDGEAATALERAMYVSPYDPASHRKLADLYESQRRFDGAIREREAVVALDPVNRAEALYRLARTQFMAGDLGGARTTVLAALEQAPAFEAAQELLLEIHERGRR